MDEFRLKMLPPKSNFETVKILVQLNRANKALAELKGYSEIIPNKNILINAVTLQEAKDSSQIENIITTHDELYKSMAVDSYKSLAAKEVINYRTALWHGYELIKEKSMLTTNMIVEIQQIVENNNAGIRKLPGTTLRNDITGEIVYTPPVGEKEILEFMGNLEQYINDNNDIIDPLIKLAVIHYQFESIHPFYDGNGRTGRIINVLYLVLQELLDSPILYLSRFIINNKQAYYRLLQEVRTKDNWEGWILYILEAVEQTSIETLNLIKKIIIMMEETENEVREKLNKIYSKDLIESVFFELYTKNAYIQDKIGINRKTAAKYLNDLQSIGILLSEKIGKEKIYLNKKLFDLLKNE
ncbi:MAG: Fic family protein [Deltaproteobacteria bacterium]